MAPTPSKYPPQGLRQPGTPTSQVNSRSQSRQASIVELLSTPPPLESSGADLEEPTAMELSRNTSISSRSSQATTSTSQTKEQHRDLKDVKLAELVESAKLIFINSSLSVEEAFKTLERHHLTSLPVEEYDGDPDCLTFDYADLNSYLMLVLGKLNLTQETFASVPYFQDRPQEVAEHIARARRGEQVPIKFVIRLMPKNHFYKFSENDPLVEALRKLACGVHRVAIFNPHTSKITGILSQRRLIKYLWDNARRFPTLEPIFNETIGELAIGNTDVACVYGDEPLINALMKMHTQNMSSLAVVDRHMNLLGNISVTDVKLLTTSSQTHLFQKSCLHFVSVILGSRGLVDGKDSFPIFHVTYESSLSRTIAKLVATRAHRMWVVKPHSKPATPSSAASSAASVLKDGTASVPLSQESTGRAGKLVGVVSLTDILNVIARRHGLGVEDPNEARKQRRRSSSSSSKSIASVEQFRRSVQNASDLR